MNRAGTRVSFAAVSGFFILLIVLPIGAIFTQALSTGLTGFIKAVMQPIGVAALSLTFKTALISAGVNAVIGTAIAYALTRTKMPGKSILNAMIDIPFAIPTTVSGLMLVLLYGPSSPIGEFFLHHGITLMYSPLAIVIAMVFVTFPFTIRAVQPLLDGMDGKVEEAAYTLGASDSRIMRTLVLPTIFPGIVTGFTLSFSRAMAELGAVVMVAGNLPMHTQVSAVYLYGLLENYDQQGAAAVSVELLCISFVAVFIQVYVLHCRPHGFFKKWPFTILVKGRHAYEATDRAL